MPEGRLERTRHPQAEIPACVRLDHFWLYLAYTDEWICRRCGLRKLGYEVNGAN